GLAAGALLDVVNGIGAGDDGGTCGVDICDCLSSNAFLKPETSGRCDRSITSPRISAKATKIIVAYLVILVSALPEPAPNKASAAPPPNASPAPASFLGNCTKISKINNRQLSTRIKVSTPAIKLIIV